MRSPIKSSLSRLTTALLMIALLLACPLRAAAETPESAGTLRLTDYSDELRRFIELTDAIQFPWRFSYEASAEVHGVRLYCERFAGAELLDETLLLERDFVDTPYTETRQGELLISGLHRYVSLRDVYYQDIPLLEADGTEIETREAAETFGWDSRSFPGGAAEDAPFLYAVVRPVNGTEKGCAIYPGERIDLALYSVAADDGADVSLGYVNLALGERITLSEVLGDACVSYLIYCVFE